MTNSRLSYRSAFILAVISGLGFAAAFPPSPLDWLAWIAIAPLLKLTEGKGALSAFQIGWVWGIAHFVALTYWIIVAVGHYGKLSLLSAVGSMVLLAMYLALYPAMFSLTVTFLRRSTFRGLWIPLSWVAIEYARAHLLTGFPWCLVGYSQYCHAVLIQSATIFGVYGLSFIIVMVNWVCYEVFLSAHRQVSGNLVIQISLTFLLVGALVFWGHRQLSANQVQQTGSSSVRVAIVQPNIDQSIKWNPEFHKRTMEIYESLSRQASRSHPDIIVWPETAVPFFFQTNTELAKRVVTLVRELGCPILFGSPAYAETQSGIEYFNRAYLLKPDGSPPQYYDKTHLVPFGEYVPLKSILSFIGKLVPGAGEFSAGSSLKPLPIDGTRVGVLICFEAIFPQIAGSEIRHGASFLANLTNDAWFGRTSAPYQHLAMAVFRAVENRVPLVRAANTGFSAVIDSNGKIKKKSHLFCQELVIGEISVGKAPSLTLYSRYGDIFAQAAVIISVLTLIVAIARKPRRPAYL